MCVNTHTVGLVKDTSKLDKVLSKYLPARSVGPVTLGARVQEVQGPVGKH